MWCCSIGTPATGKRGLGTSNERGRNRVPEGKHDCSTLSSGIFIQDNRLHSRSHMFDRNIGYANHSRLHYFMFYFDAQWVQIRPITDRIDKQWDRCCRIM